MNPRKLEPIKMLVEELEVIDMWKKLGLEPERLHSVLRFYEGQKCNLGLNPCRECKSLMCEICSK